MDNLYMKIAYWLPKRLVAMVVIRAWNELLMQGKSPTINEIVGYWKNYER